MKKGIFEAKSNYQKSLEAKVAQQKDLPASLRGEKKPAKERDPNQPTQRDWYELKKERFERQKQQELANKAAARKAEISGAIKGIQTQQISKDDKEGTAYKKLIGNVASTVGGVAKAGIAALKPAPKSAQPEMKEPGKPGRPKTQSSAPATPGTTAPATPGTTAPRLGGTPEPKLLTPQTKRLVPATKRLPPSGGTPESSRGPKPTTLGQRARQNPELKRRMIAQRNQAEQYSNWREELLIEHGLIVEVDDISTKKGKKKRIVNIFNGKNNVEINPKIGNYFGYNESYETVTEDCGCEDDKKKVLAMAILKKAIDTKKKKNFQLNSEIIGENFQDEEVKTYYKPNKSKVLKANWAVRKQAAEDKKDIKEVAAWQRKEGKNPTGGLNKKGIASYRREHPGSHLSLAVTTKPSKLNPDSKAAKRRKSFCARMGGMPGPMKDEKGRPTRKALSLRKWNC